MHVLGWIIVGLIAGWATGKIMRGSGYGAFMDIFLGIIGAVAGGRITRAFGFQGHSGKPARFSRFLVLGGLRAIRKFTVEISVITSLRYFFAEIAIQSLAYWTSESEKFRMGILIGVPSDKTKGKLGVGRRLGKNSFF